MGKAGEVKVVSDGYARNFLLPKRLALPATSSLLEKVQKEEKDKQKKIEGYREQAAAGKYKLESKIFTISVKATGPKLGDRLFAAIHEKEIARVISDKTGLELNPSQIILPEPIKSIGPAEAEVRIFSAGGGSAFGGE